MKACLGFEDIVGVGQPQIGEMERLGDYYPSQDSPGACEAFSRQVRRVEGVLVQTYGVAAALARKTDDLQEVADIWSRMGFFCQSAMVGLARLKDKYPHCGTGQLYDLALDYKLACDKRLKSVLEEISCQKVNLPKGLLPEIR